MRWTRENPTEVDPIPAIEVEPVSSAEIKQLTTTSYIANLRLLWDGRAFIMKMTILGFVCSAALIMLVPKRYESTARLMPPDSSSESMAILSAVADKTGGLGGLANNFLGLKSSSDLLVGVLRSNTLEDRLIDRFDLKKVYGITYQEDVRDRLAEYTAISIDRKSGILTITVSDRKPEGATALANAYVEELNNLTAQLSTGAAHRERLFLQERLQQVTRDLEKAEKDLSQFSSKNATLNPQDQGKAMLQAAAVLQGQLIEAQAELEGMRSIYTENSIRVRALRAEIASLQQELQKIGGKAGTEADPDSSNQLYPSLRQLPLLGVTWADLYRQAKTQEAVYEVLTRQYELAKVQEAKETPSTKVLDPPQLPQKKSYPPRTMMTLMGTFFTFCFAVLWVLGSARWNALDPRHPGKALTSEIWSTLTSSVRGIFRRQEGWHRVGTIVLRRPTRLSEKSEKEDNQE